MMKDTTCVETFVHMTIPLVFVATPPLPTGILSTFAVFLLENIAQWLKAPIPRKLCAVRALQFTNHYLATDPALIKAILSRLTELVATRFLISVTTNLVWFVETPALDLNAHVLGSKYTQAGTTMTKRSTAARLPKTAVTIKDSMMFPSLSNLPVPPALFKTNRRVVMDGVIIRIKICTRMILYIEEAKY